MFPVSWQTNALQDVCIFVLFPFRLRVSPHWASFSWPWAWRSSDSTGPADRNEVSAVIRGAGGSTWRKQHVATALRQHRNGKISGQKVCGPVWPQNRGGVLRFHVEPESLKATLFHEGNTWPFSPPFCYPIDVQGHYVLSWLRIVSPFVKPVMRSFVRPRAATTRAHDTIRRL